MATQGFGYKDQACLGVEGDMSQEETQLLPRPSSPKRKREEEQDLQLAVNDEFAPGDSPPSWALALQRSLQQGMSRMSDSLTLRLDRVLGQNEELSERMTHLENKREEDKTRLEKLEDELKSLKHELHSEARARSDPPRDIPRSVMIPPPAVLRDVSDFSHLVLGGWPIDTRKQLIEADLQRFIDTFSLIGVTKTAVFGKRARVGHIWLQPLSDQAARERFYDLLPRANKQMTATGGDLIWISPSKPYAVRERNKLLRASYDRLLKTLGLSSENDSVELDWTIGVCWVGDSRLLALDDAALLAKEGQKTIAVTFSKDLHGPAKAFYNLSGVAAIAQRTEGDVEAILRSD